MEASQYMCGSEPRGRGCEAIPSAVMGKDTCRKHETKLLLDGAVEGKEAVKMRKQRHDACFEGISFDSVLH